MAVEAHTSLVEDAHFWVLLATVIFAIIGYKLGKSQILGGLDARTRRIHDELEEAERLRVEAQELLAQYQRKHKDALKETEEMLSEARASAEKVKQKALESLDETLRWREKQLEDKISYAQEAAVDAVRQQAADIVTQATEKLLVDQLSNDNNAAKLIEESIAEVGRRG